MPEIISECLNIDFLANLFTILSVLLALCVFQSDRYRKKWENHKKYINQCLALLFELKKNQEIIIGFIEKNETEYIDGTKVAYFRFSLETSTKLISNGILKDITLMRNIDAILHSKKQINKIFDQTNLTANTCLPQSREDAKLILKSIQSANSQMIKLKNEVKKYLPNIILSLEKHIEQTTKNYTRSFCINRKTKLLPNDLFSIK